MRITLYPFNTFVQRESQLLALQSTHKNPLGIWSPRPNDEFEAIDPPDPPSSKWLAPGPPYGNWPFLSDQEAISTTSQAKLASQVPKALNPSLNFEEVSETASLSES